MDTKKIIKEEVAKFVGATTLADELVRAGMIKDEFTNLSGEKASSVVAFKIYEILDNLGLKLENI